jgi:hypothetical protein
VVGASTLSTQHRGAPRPPTRPAHHRSRRRSSDDLIARGRQTLQQGTAEHGEQMSSFLQGKMGRAGGRAALAPSVHNTQPWRYAITRGSLELYADDIRRLQVLDPRGRQLLISCGCALFNARVALAAAGYDANVQRFPDPTRPDLLARVTLPDEATGWVSIGELDTAIERRRTNRRRFLDSAVPDQVAYELAAAASAEAAELFPITRGEHRLAAARLSQEAEATKTADRAYRAEIRAWTTTDPHRGDGVLMMAVPSVDASAGDDLPIRDFHSTGLGWLPVETRSSMNQCLLLLGTLDDEPMAWVRAGEAMERVWLEITRRGYVASPLTQLIEVARTNERLRLKLQLGMHPYVLLRRGRRAGHAPVPPPPAAGPPHRISLKRKADQGRCGPHTDQRARSATDIRLSSDAILRKPRSSSAAQHHARIAATINDAGGLGQGPCLKRIRSASDHACAEAARGQEAAIELNGLPSLPS